MTGLVVVSVGLRFVLELCAFVALGYWGARAGDSLTASIVLAVGAPLAAMTVWALFVAPKARLDLGPVLRLVLELCVFAAAAAALSSRGHAGLAVALVVAYTVNKVTLATLDR